MAAEAASKVPVLIADDHGIVRNALRAFLEGVEGVQIVGMACNGMEAVALAHEHHPEVVVMDMSMPGLNGVEATRQILHESPTTRIVILTGHADEELAEEALRAGAVSYVLKARDPDEIFRTILAATETTW